MYFYLMTNFLSQRTGLFLTIARTIDNKFLTAPTEKLLRLFQLRAHQFTKMVQYPVACLVTISIIDILKIIYIQHNE